MEWDPKQNKSIENSPKLSTVNTFDGGLSPRKPRRKIQKRKCQKLESGEKLHSSNEKHVQVLHDAHKRELSKKPYKTVQRKLKEDKTSRDTKIISDERPKPIKANSSSAVKTQMQLGIDGSDQRQCVKDTKCLEITTKSDLDLPQPNPLSNKFSQLQLELATKVLGTRRRDCHEPEKPIANITASTNNDRKEDTPIKPLKTIPHLKPCIYGDASKICTPHPSKTSTPDGKRFKEIIDEAKRQDAKKESPLRLKLNPPVDIYTTSPNHLSKNPPTIGKHDQNEHIPKFKDVANSMDTKTLQQAPYYNAQPLDVNCLSDDLRSKPSQIGTSFKSKNVDSHEPHVNKHGTKQATTDMYYNVFSNVSHKTNTHNVDNYEEYVEHHELSCPTITGSSIARIKGPSKVLPMKVDRAASGIYSVAGSEDKTYELSDTRLAVKTDDVSENSEDFSKKRCSNSTNSWLTYKAAILSSLFVALIVIAVSISATDKSPGMYLLLL